MVVAAATVVVVLLVVVVPLVDAQDRWAGPRLFVGALPSLAVDLLPETEELLADCPQMPIGWLYAVITVESSWEPTAFSTAGAAGLVQMMPSSWREAGGDGAGWSRANRPSGAHPVWEPATHLQVAVPWMCARLTQVTLHLAETGKPIDPLDAAAVCHVAGCLRVYASQTGIPEPGDAGCDEACSDTVASYVARVRAVMGRITGPDGTVAVADAPGPAPLPAPVSGGCDLPDPTGTGGCVTARAAHLVTQVTEQWRWPWPVACWGTRPNPMSDHPHGRACDLTVGTIGGFPSPRDREAGWAMATWLTAYAPTLAVRYVVWDGHIWQARTGTWERYGGGGIYDPSSPTGGHYDHLHVSLEP